MTLRVAVVVLVIFGCATARAQGNRVDIGPFALGGRAEYATRIDRDAVPFRWNDATHSLHDRTRLMLDMAVNDSGFGQMYLKGAALWDDTRPSDVQKKFRFEQGDYLWARAGERLDYSLRFFANERRFFVEDGIAPLMRDDAISDGDGNGGARFDALWRRRLSATGLYSVLGSDFNRSRQMAYLGTRYAAGILSGGVSYLFNNLGEHAVRNHAVFKVDAAAVYKKAMLLVAYEQSELADRSLFFPAGRFDWDVYEGSNFAAALPAGGAFLAELRASEIQVRNRARLKFTYLYTAAGSEFVNDVGWNHGAQVGHTASAFLQANDVDINGRLRYHTSQRFNLESETRDVVEGSVWGALRAGVWVVARGALAEIEEDGSPEDHNLIHLGAERRIKELRSGVHFMWQDLGTLFSERRFAVDAKFPLSPNWGFYFRLIAARDFDLAQTSFARLDYRPTDRVFATLSYGRGDLGDGPFLIEDADIDLARGDTAVYRISIRGDF